MEEVHLELGDRLWIELLTNYMIDLLNRYMTDLPNPEDHDDLLHNNTLTDGDLHPGVIRFLYRMMVTIHVDLLHEGTNNNQEVEEYIKTHVECKGMIQTKCWTSISRS